MHLRRVKREQQKVAIYNLVFSKRKRLDWEKTYLVIHNQWSINGYYHWIVDSMSRLWSIKDKLQDLWLLLPDSARQTGFIQGTLKYFDGLNIEYLEPNRIGYVHKLVLPSHLPYWGILRPDFLKQFRDKILVKLPTSSSVKLIYISRKNANRRKIVNEEDVMQMLTEFGFEHYVLEKLSFDEQVILFRQAKIVVSIHGAGLTNTIFMEEGTAIVELLKEPKNSEKYLMEYQRLAFFFKLNFFALASEPINKDASFDKADLLVNIQELRNVIINILTK
jgi:capsular polysaccharide biosynthesis protein